MAEATGPAARSVRWWCRVFTCPNHAGRESLGLPVGWLRVILGCRDTKLHAMTFCSAACLRHTMEQAPAEFEYNPAIDRHRVERARQRRRTGPFNGPRRRGEEAGG